MLVTGQRREEGEGKRREQHLLSFTNSSAEERNIMLGTTDDDEKRGNIEENREKRARAFHLYEDTIYYT